MKQRHTLWTTYSLTGVAGYRLEPTCLLSVWSWPGWQHKDQARPVRVNTMDKGATMASSKSQNAGSDQKGCAQKGRGRTEGPQGAAAHQAPLCAALPPVFS